MQTSSEPSTHIQSERYWLISWLILPLICLWFAISYLVGEINLPQWYNPTVTNNQGMVQNITNWQWDGEGVVTLWFDDGHISQYTTAAPLLTSMNTLGSLAVTTRAVDTPGYMNWNQVRGLHNQGWDVHAHTRTHHCSLDQAEEATVIDEIIGSKEDMTKKNLPALDFVTPCGVENDYIKNLVKENFRSLRTSYPGDNQLPLLDPYAIKAYALRNYNTVEEVKEWVNQAINNKSWVVLMFHQVDSSGTEYSVSTQDFKSMMKIVSDSGVQVVPANRIIEYSLKAKQ